MLAIAELANSLKNVQEINLEPYHPLGVGKCARLGVASRLEKNDFADEKSIETWFSLIRSKTRVSVKKS